MFMPISFVSKTGMLLFMPNFIFSKKKKQQCLFSKTGKKIIFFEEKNKKLFGFVSANCMTHSK